VNLRHSIAIGAAVAVLTAASCAESTAPATPLVRDTTALFQTDSLRYTLRADDEQWTGVVSWVFTNSTAAPVSFLNCGGQTLLIFQRRVPGGWVSAWGPGTFECLSPPITVEPGQQYTATIAVHVRYPWLPFSSIAAPDDMTGTFRIVWERAVPGDGSFPFSAPLPLEQRVSNAFELRLQDP
jgi:hypothetical protein